MISLSDMMPEPTAEEMEAMFQADQRHLAELEELEERIYRKLMGDASHQKSFYMPNGAFAVLTIPQGKME